MRLLALIEHEDHVCYRYRLAAMRDDLAKQGWQLEPLVQASGVLPFYRQLATIAAADAVVLQRKLLSWWKLKLLRGAARRLIYDIDDARFLRDSNSSQSAHSPRRWQRFRAAVRAADLVMAGNDFLVAAARRCLSSTQAGRVCYLPTVVDPAAYSCAQHERRESETQLVWIGSRSTMASLIEAQPALAACAEAVSNMQLKVICDCFPLLAGVEIVRCPWNESSEAAEIATADIGISWLPPHPWSEGKCGLKVLQYMAAGLPVVANPVALHKTLIIEGVTGFLASTPAEWVAVIKRLAASPELRIRIGRAARAYIEERYSTAAWGPKLAERIDHLRRPLPQAA
jgi:hypothetical protein